MEITVNDNIKLQTLVPEHAEELYELILASKEHLQRWLPWVKNVDSINYIENFIQETILRSDNKTEFAFVIFYKETMAGRIGLYHLQQQNKIGEIGYWLGKDYVGKGIIGQCCAAIIDYGFEVAELNRIVIKSGTENTESFRIPEKLGFTKEGILRQAELLDEGFIDLNLYSLLKSEWTQRNA